MATTLHIGTAGWALGTEAKGRFSSGESLLERYATRFSAVEINTSFYRTHRPATYRRWAASVPRRFRFAVKFPKAVSHERGLSEVRPLLEEFLSGCLELGENLGPLLLQLPPRFGFSASLAEEFFSLLRSLFQGEIVCEPRHSTWASAEAEKLLLGFGVGRAGTDPVVLPGGEHPLREASLWYYRLHGSPKVYYSPYSDNYKKQLAKQLTLAAEVEKKTVWCIFDNTAEGAATHDALDVLEQVTQEMAR